MIEKFAFSFFSQLFSKFLSIISFYFVLIYLNVALLGLWTFLLSVINLGFLFIDIGINTIHLQYSNKKNYDEYFGTFITIKLVLLVINILITLLLFYFLKLYVKSLILIIIFLLISKVLTHFSDIFIINFKSKLKVFKSEIPLLLNSLAKSLSNIYLAYNISNITNPLLYLSALYLLSDCIMTFIILFFYKNEFKPIKPKKKYIVEYLRDAKFLLLFSIISVIATNIGNLIVLYSIGSIELGYFSFINDYIIMLLLFISRIFLQLWIVLYSSYFEEGKYSLIEQTTNLIERIFSIFTLLIIILVFLNAKSIFSLVFPNYINSLPILYIMVFLPYILAISRPYFTILVAGRKQKITFNSYSTIYIIVTIMMFFLIPKYILTIQALGLGIIGYALSQTIPWILWLIFSRYFTKKYFNIKPRIKIFAHIPLALLSLFFGIIIKEFILIPFFKEVFFNILISSIITFLIFIILLIISKELTIKDFNLFSQLFKYRNYIHSLKQEFS